MIDREAREKEKRFRDWLSYSARENEKELRKNLRHQASSPPSWIIDLPEYNTWLEVNISERAKLLWLSGTTGFGKSVIAAYFVNELTKTFKSKAVTFFFCKDNEFLRSAYQLMITFLYQASLISPNIRTDLKKTWEKENEFQDSSEAEIEHL